MRTTSEDLEKGEVKCNKCNATGTDENDVYLCDKCDGEGKIDWISNAIEKPIRMSSLRRVDIKRAIYKLKKLAESNFPNVDQIYSSMWSYLDTLQQHNVVYEFKVDRNENVFEVFIKPSRAIEIIKLDLVIIVEGTI
jgi:RecJ-like exonuclease